MISISFSWWSLYCGTYSSSGGVDRCSGNNGLKNQFHVRARALTRLFLAFGLTWIADVVSWFIHFKIEEPVSPASVYISLVFDGWNASQGLVMFALVFLDRATINRYR